MKATIKRKLRPHQQQALERLTGSSHPAILHSMRLGKTLTLIRWVKEQHPDLRRVLIVCPTSVGKGWEEELRCEREQCMVLLGNSSPENRTRISELFSGEKQQPRRRWVILGYGGLTALAPRKESYLSFRRSRELPEVASLPWDLVCLDESPVIKGPGTIISEICTSGFKTARHRAILSGMLAPESLLDVFQQFKFLHGQFLGCATFWEFRAKLFKKAGFKWVPKSGVQAKIQRELSKLAVMLTRKQAGVPDSKVYEVRRVEMSRQQRKLYQQAEDEFALSLPSGLLETKWSLPRRKWMEYLCGGFTPERELLNPAKSREILALLRGELSGEKAVILFQFRHELAHMEIALQCSRISYSSLHGGMAYQDRKASLSEFQKGSSRVFLATEKAIRYGATLAVSDTLIYYSNEPSTEYRVQSEDRILDLSGSAKLILDIVTEDSLDEDKLKALRLKVAKAQMLMEMENAFKQRRGRR